jgi:hypothetical protein
VIVNDNIDIDDLKKEIIKQHSKLSFFVAAPSAADWHLYKSAEAQEPGGVAASIFWVKKTCDKPPLIASPFGLGFSNHSIELVRKAQF